jgi:hypothetical protein
VMEYLGKEQDAEPIRGRAQPGRWQMAPSARTRFNARRSRWQPGVSPPTSPFCRLPAPLSTIAVPCLYDLVIQAVVLLLCRQQFKLLCLGCVSKCVALCLERLDLAYNQLCPHGNGQHKWQQQQQQQQQQAPLSLGLKVGSAPYTLNPLQRQQTPNQ